MRKYVLTIIILTYNRYDNNKELIESLLANYNDFEIVIIDNNSSDKTKSYLESIKNKNNVKIKILDENVGIPRARNIGAEISTSEYLLFIDNDIVIKSDIRNLISVFKQNEKLAVIGAKMINYYTGELDTWVYNINKKYALENFYTYTFAGGAVAIRKNAFFQVGGYEDILFFAQEEKELSLKLIAAGYEIIYYKEFLCIHKHVIENKVVDDRRLYYNFKNNLLIMYLNMPMLLFIVFFVRFIFVKGLWLVYYGKYKLLVKIIKQFMKDKEQVIRHTLSIRSILKYIKIKNSIKYYNA